MVLSLYILRYKSFKWKNSYFKSNFCIGAQPFPSYCENLSVKTSVQGPSGEWEREMMNSFVPPSSVLIFFMWNPLGLLIHPRFMIISASVSFVPSGTSHSFPSLSSLQLSARISQESSSVTLWTEWASGHPWKVWPYAELLLDNLPLLQAVNDQSSTTSSQSEPGST